MADPADRLRNFEARLNALKHKMEAGLAGRAEELRGAAARLLEGDETARGDIKRLSHKLRGIAGTYGHMELTELAGNVEQRASISPPPVVAELARELAEAAIRISSDSSPAVEVLSEPPPPKPVVKPAAPSEEAPLRVLGMDDDPNTLKLLTLTLQQVGGFDAVVVDSATAALEQLKQREFDMVVSDAMMPDMNGLEFCQAARALGGSAAQIPIVILSAATAEELGWTNEVDLSTGWLRKPFRPTGLVEEIKQIVARHRDG